MKRYLNNCTEKVKLYKLSKASGIRLIISLIASIMILVLINLQYGFNKKNPSMGVWDSEVTPKEVLPKEKPTIIKATSNSSQEIYQHTYTESHV